MMAEDVFSLGVLAVTAVRFCVMPLFGDLFVALDAWHWKRVLEKGTWACPSCGHDIRLTYRVISCKKGWCDCNGRYPKNHGPFRSQAEFRAELLHMENALPETGRKLA